MTREEAIKWLNVERELIVEIPQDNSAELKEAYDLAIKALEQTSHLTDRPCSACDYHTENGCSKWSCVFEEMGE